MSVRQIPFRPALEGFFANRFYREVKRATSSSCTNDDERFRKLVDAEIAWAKTQKNGLQSAIYQAVWRLLHDLHRVGWSFSWTKNCLMLTKPTSSENVTGKAAIDRQKKQIREAMSFARVEKIALYGDFIDRMLRPTGNGLAKLPITALIGNGSCSAKSSSRPGGPGVWNGELICFTNR